VCPTWRVSLLAAKPPVPSKAPESVLEKVRRLSMGIKASLEAFTECVIKMLLPKADIVFAIAYIIRAPKGPLCDKFLT